MHRSKIQRLSHFTIEELAIVENQLFERVTVIPNDPIAPSLWEKAADLVKGVDERDDHYVALALHLRCPLWTGDKKLIAGLRKKGFKLLITTEELRKKLA